MAAHSGILAWRPPVRGPWRLRCLSSQTPTRLSRHAVRKSVWSALPAAGRGVSQELPGGRLLPSPPATRATRSPLHGLAPSLVHLLTSDSLSKHLLSKRLLHARHC